MMKRRPWHNCTDALRSHTSLKLLSYTEFGSLDDQYRCPFRIGKDSVLFVLYFHPFTYLSLNRKTLTSVPSDRVQWHQPLAGEGGDL